MIEYLCPVCDNKVNIVVLTSNPPITKYYCGFCGWSREEREPIIEIKLDKDGGINNAIIT